MRKICEVWFTGSNMNERRKDLSLTHKRLSEISGIPERSLYRWENEDTFPNVENLRQLSKALKCVFKIRGKNE